MFDLTDRVAVVTGAGQGVGRGIAEALCGRGAIVAVNDRDPERAERVVSALRATGATADAAPFDVGDHGAVLHGLGAVADARGPVEILVNNAGIPPDMELRPFRDTTPEEWRAYFDVNTQGVMHCCHAVLDGMRQAGWGRIITISSGAATVGSRFGTSVYGASKGAAIAFMRNLALEEARRGLTVNTVALGMMDTIGAQDGDELAGAARGVPVGRLGRPADAGALCVYLASDDAAWMTGQTIQLNGGAPTT